MIELNPEIVDQEKIRTQKRRRQLKLVFLPIIILLLISIYLIRTGLYNVAFSFSYANQDYDNAKNIGNIQEIANIISPFLTDYNTGVIYLKKSQYEEAESSFRNSLKKEPPKDMLCKVYVNLSLSIELQADQKERQKEFKDAASLYDRAETILYKNNCADKTQKKTGKDEVAEDAKDRLIEKRARALSDDNLLEGHNNQGGISGIPSEEVITPEDIKNIKLFGNAIEDYMNSRHNASGGDSRNNTEIRW